MGCPSITVRPCCLLPGLGLVVAATPGREGLQPLLRGQAGAMVPGPAREVLPAHIWARAGSLETVSQGLGPASSCSVCACLQGHPSWRWSSRSPRLCIAPAHRGPNNGFIRAEPLSLCCCSFAITS